MSSAATLTVNAPPAINSSPQNVAGETYVFTAIAGQPPQPGSTDGITNNARFYFPSYTVVDSAGNVYVSDTFNHTIRKITSAGVVTTFAGAAGQSGSADGTLTAARFNRPNGLAFDGSGDLFVADYNNNTVRKITPAGIVSTVAGLAGVPGTADGTGGSARFNAPQGIVADMTGNIYVTDRLNHIVRKISTTGAVSTIAGLAGSTGAIDGVGTSARFWFPTGITIDGAGNLYVVDAGTATLRKINPAGAVTTMAGSPFNAASLDGIGTSALIGTPEGIAIDPVGNLYLTDSYNHNVRKVAPDGAVTTVAGWLIRGAIDDAGAAARFSNPVGIAIDGAGNLVVVDSDNHAIRKITVGGVVSTFVGPLGNTGTTDGNGRAARFYYPRGITGDSKGNLFVCDETNQTIRRITPAGDVTTFAGLTTTSFTNLDGIGNAARFAQPVGICADNNDNMYVSDNLSGTIRKITPTAVVTTLAGSATGGPGSTDGIGANARFWSPNSAAVDSAGNIYVADTTTCIIRKILPDGTVSTLAGKAGESGSADGAGSLARFFYPSGVAVDRSGNIFVADALNQAIRKITPAGVVSTFAGSVGSEGSTDGIGPLATFAEPDGIAVDQNGNVFIADTGNGLIRKITAAGLVTTIGGSRSVFNTPDGVGANAHFILPTAIWVSPQSVLYITDALANTVIKGVPETIPVIATQPQSTTVLLGTAATFSVAASGGDVSYQWKLNGTAIPGATSSTYSVTGVSQAIGGNYTVDVTNFVGTTTSSVANLNVTLPGRLINLAVLAPLDIAGDTFSLGFVVSGASAPNPKLLVIRAAGPSLGALGVPGTLSDPKLELFAASTKTSENDNWGGSAATSAAMAAVGAFAYTGPTSLDAALVANVTSSDNSVKISAGASAPNGTGAVIAEVYDATPTASFTTTTPRLINFSAIKSVGTSVTLGFVIGGATSEAVLVRAVGPSLGIAPFNLGGVMADPKIELFDANGKSLATNDNWGGTAALTAAFSATGAFTLPATSKDAALVATLAPGNYSVVVTPATGTTTGIALVEVYEVP